MHEAKTNLSKLVTQVQGGEEIFLARAGDIVCKLVPYTLHSQPKRKPGGWKGKIWIAPDFDETTPEILEMFYGSDDENFA